LVEESKPSKAFYSLLDEGMQLMLHDMVNDASWKKEELEEKLLQDIFLRLFACIPPSIVAIEDVLMWNSLQDDNMSVASTYKTREGASGTYGALYNLIWCWAGSEKIYCFLWKVSKKAILTNNTMRARGISDSDGLLIVCQWQRVYFACNQGLYYKCGSVV